MRKKLKNCIISIFLCTAVSLSLTGISTLGASAFDDEYISEDGMALGYSIINGYTKMSMKSNPQKTSSKIAVYSGVDITSPYVLTMGGLYILSHHVDFDEFLSDNDYAMEFIGDFDSYMKKVGIKNEKSPNFVKSVSDKKIKFEKQLDTAGIFIFEAENDYAVKLMENNPYVDFVLVDGKVPSNMKDLNFDGVTDIKDAELMQHYLAGDLELADDDEASYALYATDYNKDKEINIEDVTDLQKDIFKK
ncbi:MAG TPA: hypothetical protein DD413_09345 [Ruminococcus sp.]|nr:hypothetical protein [Ruminococcus sp.]